MASPLALSFVPVFSPKNRKVHAKYVLAHHREMDWKVGHGFPPKAAPAALAGMTSRLFDALAHEITGHPERLIVPVSAKALLGVENANSVLDSLRRIDEADRARIIVEVHDFPTTINLDTVEEATIPLLLYVGGFVARMPPGLEDATVFSNCNYIALTIDYATAPSEKPLVDIWKVAAPKRLKYFIWNLPESEIADAERLEVFGATAPQ